MECRRSGLVDGKLILKSARMLSLKMRLETVSIPDSAILSSLYRPDLTMFSYGQWNVGEVEGRVSDRL